MLGNAHVIKDIGTLRALRLDQYTEPVMDVALRTLRASRLDQYTQPATVAREGGCDHMELRLTYDNIRTGPDEGTTFFPKRKKEPSGSIIIKGRSVSVTESRQPQPVLSGLQLAADELDAQIGIFLDGNHLGIEVVFDPPRRISDEVTSTISRCIEAEKVAAALQIRVFVEVNGVRQELDDEESFMSDLRTAHHHGKDVAEALAYLLSLGSNALDPDSPGFSNAIGRDD